MPCEQVTITTRDGPCPVYVFAGASGKKSPAIIFYIDAGGIRPAVLAMAERLAETGYVVLLPDLFYRFGSYGPFDPAEVLKGDFRAILGPLVATTGNAKSTDDTEALLAFIDARTDVANGKVGAVGFCMGGGMAISAAGVFPDRFAAVASFHGGNLATDAADSPHLYVAGAKAEFYIAVAENDSSYPPSMAKKFEAAMTDAGVSYRSHNYPAQHGWMMPDFPAYDEMAAEDGWRAMLAFFERLLRCPPISAASE